MSELTLWTEPLAESNCYLLAEDGGCVVIDPNHPQGPLRVLEERGWSPELILLTHEHCDHTAGLEACRERYPAAGYSPARPAAPGWRVPGSTCPG